MDTPAAPYWPVAGSRAAGFAEGVRTERTAGIGFPGSFTTPEADADTVASGAGVRGLSFATGSEEVASGGGVGGITIPVDVLGSGPRLDAMTTAVTAIAARAMTPATIASGAFDFPGAVWACTTMPSFVFIGADAGVDTATVAA